MNTRFLFYNKRNTFEADKHNLTENQIAFIAETRTIYTHGIEFNCFSSSSEILNKLKFRLNGSTIQYSIDGGSTWEKLIDLNDVDWTKVTNLKQVIQNIINQNADLTAIQNRISKLEGDISTINNTLSNHNTRITNLENKGGGDNTGSDYILPTANSTTLGGIRTGFAESNTNRDYAVKLDSNAKAYVHVPWVKGEGGGTTPSEPTSKYKAFAFYTVHYDDTTDSYKSDEVTAVTQTPTGFDSSKSIPTSPEGCTDTAIATSSKDLIYMTSAWIVDGELDGSWTPFTLMKDTTDFDVCFNSSETKPSAPTTHGTQNGGNGWYDDVTNLSVEAVWMATSTLNNGTWSEWQIVRIKGEKGEDGTSIKIVGELDGTRYTSISILTTLSNGDDRSIGLLLSNGSRYTGLKAGDCFKIAGGALDGHIVCCNDDTPNYVWTDLGNIQGPAGEDGTDGESSHLHIKFSNDVQPDETGHATSGTFTGNNGANPGKYMGTLVDNNVSASNNIGDYKWQLCKGEDGFGYEYIYTSLTERYVNNSAFQTPAIDTNINQTTTDFYATMDGESVSSSQTNATYSVVWSDERMVCDAEHPYIYRAWKKTNKTSGYFSGNSETSRSPLLIDQYQDSSTDSETDVEQITYYAVNDSSTEYPQPPSILESSQYTGGYYIHDNDNWGQEPINTTNPGECVWKINYTCYDKITNGVYKRIISSGAILAQIAGVGNEVNGTGADWIFKGQWKSTTKYNRTTDEIPYVSYGYQIRKENGDVKYSETITNATYGAMTQYWFLSRTASESTGQKPGTTETSEIWIPFDTTEALSAQFASIDQIAARKISTAELNANQIKTGKLNANFIEGGSIKSSNLFIQDSSQKYGDGSQYPWVVGGMASTQNNTDYALWVGSSIDGDGLTDEEILTDVFNEDTSEIPFKVTRAGKLYAKDAEISGNASISGNIHAKNLYLGEGSIFVLEPGSRMNLPSLSTNESSVVYVVRKPFPNITATMSYTIASGNDNSNIYFAASNGASSTTANQYDEVTVKSDVMCVGYNDGTSTLWRIYELLYAGTPQSGGNFGQ